MKLDFSSFLLGCGVGAGSMLLGKRLRPVMLEVATLLFRLQERAMAATPMGQEALAELLAEARARVSLPAGFGTGRHPEPTHPRTGAPATHPVKHPSPFGRGTG
ncbi:hypothetical protein ATI61_104317 [Archangium gephyra]|uniref:Uncharacterized protein n=1 Tax=Archangium gephyra TaxID=48 RepID=A0AAC8Q354_9BACT|nr:hypothetical protein [Archangium gephyra]AKJ00275.1 Hypothetical protein AA314_01901 [Archangium gephyra]REG33027.1 hypothetical protein ATI61_104317 [Archangium gephyra]